MTEPIVAGLPIDDLAPLTGDAPAAKPQPAPTAKPDVAPVAIDWSKVDPTQIPAELVKATPQFKDVLTESVNRRQQLKALKDQIDTGEPAPKGEPKPAPKPDDSDTPAWAKQIIDRLDKVETLATVNGRKALLDDAITTFNLPASSATWITATDAAGIKAQAAELAKTFNLPAPGTVAGNGQTSTQTDRYKAAIMSRVKGQQGPIDPLEGSLFNPSIQDRIVK